jgi:hypothetical protein
MRAWMYSASRRTPRMTNRVSTVSKRLSDTGSDTSELDESMLVRSSKGSTCNMRNMSSGIVGHRVSRSSSRQCAMFVGAISRV